MAAQADYNEDCDLIDSSMAVPLDGILGGEVAAAAGSLSQIILAPPMFVSDEDGTDMVDLMLHQDAEVGDPKENAEVTVPTISPLTTVATQKTPSPSAPSRETPGRPPLTSMKTSDTTQSSSRLPYSTVLEARKGSCARHAPGTAMNTTSNHGLTQHRAAKSKECTGNVKHTAFQERNRVAASKCREKQKQRVHKLKIAEEELEARHKRLEAELRALLDETAQLRNHLMSHAGCGNANIDLWVENQAVSLVPQSRYLTMEY